MGYIFGAGTPEVGDNEPWTRAQFGAFGLDDEATAVQGIYGSLVIDRLTGEWTYTLDQDDPDTEALGAGQLATESFSLRVIDDSQARPLPTSKRAQRGTRLVLAAIVIAGLLLAAMLAMAVVRKREQDALRREMIERRIREISEE